MDASKIMADTLKQIKAAGAEAEQPAEYELLAGRLAEIRRRDAALAGQAAKLQATCLSTRDKEQMGAAYGTARAELLAEAAAVTEELRAELDRLAKETPAAGGA